MERQVAKLTYKQQRFIDLYDGNGTKTARKAGYKGNNNSLAVTASRLLNNPKIISAIKNRDAEGILSRKKIQELWTEIFTDESLPCRIRLKASDSLAKSLGMFKEHVEIEDNIQKLSDEELENRIKARMERLGLEYKPILRPVK